MKKSDVDAFVSKFAPAVAQKLRGLGQQAPQARRARGRRRNQALNANALLASLPKGPAPPKEARFKGGATRSSVFAPRGQGYYDAFASTPDATILSHTVGPCTPIEGYARLIVPGSAGVTNLSYDLPNYTGATPDATVQGSVTTNAKLIVFNVGSSDSELARTFELVADPTDATKALLHTVAVHASAFEELGPTFGSAWDPAWRGGLEAHNPEKGAHGHPAGKIESIPLRGSMCIRNITEHFSVGGEVRMMRYNGGLSIGNYSDMPSAGATEALFGVADFLEVCDMMRDTKRATTMGAEELLVTHQMNTYPADAIRSQTFHNDTTFHEAVLSPKFCTLVILIDDFKSSYSQQVNNTYSLNLVAHRAARFRPGSLLHHKAKVLPVDPDAHHKLTTHEASRSVAIPTKRDSGSGFMDTLSSGIHDYGPGLVQAGLQYALPAPLKGVSALAQLLPAVNRGYTIAKEME